jgi:hypothetical protein
LFLAPQFGDESRWMRGSAGSRLRQSLCFILIDVRFWITGFLDFVHNNSECYTLSPEPFKILLYVRHFCVPQVENQCFEHRLYATQSYFTTGGRSVSQWRVLIMKILIMQPSPTSYHFIPLLYISYLLVKILPCAPCSQTPLVYVQCSLLKVRDKVSHPQRITGKITVLHVQIFSF